MREGHKLAAFVDATATQPRGDDASSNMEAMIRTPVYAVVQFVFVQDPLGIRIEDNKVSIRAYFNTALLAEPEQRGGPRCYQLYELSQLDTALRHPFAVQESPQRLDTGHPG